METPSSKGSEEAEVISPFTGASTTLPVSGGQERKLGLWIGLVVLFVVIGGAGGIFIATSMNDPLRTLEKFPVAKYLDNYHALAGAKFKSELRVEADLGWKEHIGRLMVFTVTEDPRPLVLMIPAQFSSIYFSKGQTYVAELEVKEGGLIYANSCRKH